MTLSRVVIDKRVLEAFKRRALKAYPNEHIEALWGRVREDSVNVYAVCHLKKLKASPDFVEYETADADELRETGYKFVGNIHTHPDDDCQPSEADKRCFRHDEEDSHPQRVMGICSIQIKRARRFTGFAFYGKRLKLLELVIAE